MDKNFEKNIGLFLMESIEDSIRKLRKADKDYCETRKSHIEKYDRYEGIIKNLSGNDKEFIEDFEDQMVEIHAKEQNWLYLEGYRDCINLLKFIELI